jgi:hypothetical protein
VTTIMEQFHVTKKGSLKTTNWNPRVLSVSRSMGVISLSDVDDATNRFARSMRVTSVKGWPDYHRSYIPEKFTSDEAKLTLRVKGELGTVTEAVLMTAQGVVRRYNYTKQFEVADDAWMIRFASEDDLNRAKQLFMRMPRVKTPPVTRQNTEFPPSAVSAR